MFRHLILATTIAVALSGCAQMAAGSRPHTDTGTPDISTFLHPENARPDGMSDTGTTAAVCLRHGSPPQNHATAPVHRRHAAGGDGTHC